MAVDLCVCLSVNYNANCYIYESKVGCCKVPYKCIYRCMNCVDFAENTLFVLKRLANILEGSRLDVRSLMQHTRVVVAVSH